MNRTTCWTLIDAVRAGDRVAKDDFVERYLSPVRAYLRARWQGGALASECDDAVQEVFLRCFGRSSPLERVTPDNEGGFQAFLYGICRNVAREVERARSKGGARDPESDLDRREGNQERLTKTFDRAFARQVMKEARDRYREQVEAQGEEAQQRFELLRLRFESDVPIREIAKRWDQSADKLHKAYARARREYREALFSVVAEQNPGRSQADLERSAKRLLDALA
jgi:RNA polymerase sigma factor (sigma-70 family)